MRVVLLNQYYAPDSAATAQILADLGEGLAADGHEVSAVCSSRAYDDPVVRYPRRETIRGVAVRRTWTTGFGRASSIGRVLDYLTFVAGAARLLLLRRRPDVVVSLSTPPLVAVLGCLLARVRGARSIYWVMDVYPDLAFELGVMRPGSIVGGLFRRISRYALRASDAVVALGETMASRLCDLRGAMPVVIHNWADGELIRPRPAAAHPLREQWGWTDKFVVLYSGNLGLAHEFETVIRAARSLSDHPEILFAFVGDGPRRPEVEAQVRRLGLANVEFRGYQAREQLGQSLTAGDLHLVTLRERMPGLLVPSKIYGILAAGRPTVYVGPDEGEIAEIIRAGDCGVRIATGDDDGLAEAILRCAGDEVFCLEKGRRARRLFDERFTKQHGLRAFQRLIQAEAGRLR